MSIWNKVCLSTANILVKLLVKSKSIPHDPNEDLSIDNHNPILYVLPYNSKIDLMVVRSLCEKHDLPNPLDPITIGNATLPAYLFVDKEYDSKEEYFARITTYLDAYLQDPFLDIQLLPVSVLFSRAPDREGKEKLSLQPLGIINKMVKMIFSGRSCYTRFSNPASLKQIISSREMNSNLPEKLSRLALIHFSKQRIASIGPSLPSRQKMLNQLLSNPVLKEAIQEEAKSKNISIEKARKNALSMLNEVAANFTYRMLRITDFVLTWAWNRLYQGLKITNADPVRELAQNGHEIIYAPCHRSHMDYLLLSYVLYRQGLVPPHIAAGINLNFWPAGPIFRRLGAFFIRRSFRGNKLYTAIFREYLAKLFIRGYSVEYFIEGGRSRTGRLLDPKTGMLLMTMQTLLRGDTKPISIVPVYIGYEHVLEVATYSNELRGAAKQKESLWQTIKAFFKLKKLGFGYVNFGEPITLNQFLNHQIPEWRDAIDPSGTARPSWLTPTTNELSTQIMENINSSAAVNAMNLCCTVLLASHKGALTKRRLIEHLNNTIILLKNVPYSDLITFPDEDAEALFEHAKNMGKFIITEDDVGEIISFNQEQAILMTYYRNNIQHLIIIPSLIARIVARQKSISKSSLIDKIVMLYPFLKKELFIYHNNEQLFTYLNSLIEIFIKINLIEVEDEIISPNLEKISSLQLLAANVKDTLKRYSIAFALLQKDPEISRATLSKESRLIAERLSVLYGINSPEFFDKGVFSTLMTTLKEQEYFNGQESVEKITSMNQILKPLVSHKVLQTIDDIGDK